MADSTTPIDEQLGQVAKDLRAATPELGIAKLLARIKEQNPSWSVSEKRLRKVLQSLDPALANGGSGSSPDEAGLVAETGLDPSVNVTAIAPKVKARLFGGEKGKGLVAKEKIYEGEVVWQEDPWIVTASPDLYDILSDRHMCSQCFTLFPARAPPRSVPCPRCDRVQFCSRLCLAKASSVGGHMDLLCPGQNPSCEPLLQHIKSGRRRHLDAVSKIIARWRAERDWGTPEGAQVIETRVWGGMARISIEVKEKERREWEYVGEPRQKEWREGHELLVRALNPRQGTKEAKAFGKLLQARHPRKEAPRPLTEDEEKRWFSYESYLELLGLAGLNQEDSGGLYALHAHINHSCEPNLIARNLPKGFVPPPPESLPCPVPPPNPPGVIRTNKISILARRTIHPGDELTLPYVNYNLPRDERRGPLRELYGFWCQCGKCQRESKAA